MVWLTRQACGRRRLYLGYLLPTIEIISLKMAAILQRRTVILAKRMNKQPQEARFTDPAMTLSHVMSKVRLKSLL